MSEGIKSAAKPLNERKRGSMAYVKIRSGGKLAY